MFINPNINPMKQRVFLLSCLLAFAFAAMAQIDTGKWYRVKDVGTGLYFTALNHEKHEGAVGGVAVAEKEQDNLEQVFRLEDAGGGFYKLQTLTGYNVCFSPGVRTSTKDTTRMAVYGISLFYRLSNLRRYVCVLRSVVHTVVSSLIHQAAWFRFPVPLPLLPSSQLGRSFRPY